jgi:hypothetical protein
VGVKRLGGDVQRDLAKLAGDNWTVSVLPR